MEDYIKLQNGTCITLTTLLAGVDYDYYDFCTISLADCFTNKIPPMKLVFETKPKAEHWNGQHFTVLFT